MIRILIADDQRLFRTALNRSLGEVTGIEIVGEAGDGEEAVRMAVEHCPDVVLMDFAMPLLNGMEATRRIRRKCPNTRVIGLSIYDNPGMDDMMLAAGAAAYVTKGCDLDTTRRDHPQRAVRFRRSGSSLMRRRRRVQDILNCLMKIDAPKRLPQERQPAVGNEP